jgi:hypothetical protein
MRGYLTRMRELTRSIARRNRKIHSARKERGENGEQPTVSQHSNVA